MFSGKKLGKGYPIHMHKKGHHIFFQYPTSHSTQECICVYKASSGTQSHLFPGMSSQVP